MSDSELQRHLRAVIDLHADGTRVHFRLVGITSIALGELALFVTGRLGMPEAKVFELFVGLSPESTTPANALQRLTTLATEKLGDVHDLDSVRVLAGDDPEFAAAVEEYLDEYGCRALNYELAVPTLRERPGLVLSLVRDRIGVREEDGDEPRRAREAAAEIREGLDESQRGEFDHLLERAQRAYPVREDNEYWTLSAPNALLRWAALESGRRLAEAGRLEDAEHVFFLEPAELLEAMHDGEDVREKVRQRRGEHRWAVENPGPASYGKAPGAPPSMDQLPVEVRTAMGAFQWAMQSMSGSASSGGEHGSDTLRGVPGAAGSYTGPVRIVRGEHEFDRIRAGDVLVCPITSPVWSVLFPSVGALVTDTGGPLSHAAIIAREFGIPATVASGDATSVLADGALVTVDGTAGTVEVHSDGWRGQQDG